MGIKHVWTILSPYCERKPLFELQGKTIAIDLSCWICEAQNVVDYYVQPRMYLRNLYFRTCYLLLMDVSPVFVLEGKAPGMKYDTIAARNAIQFKGSRPKEKDENGDNKKAGGKDRTQFHFVLKRCSEMLEYMGLACITGSGEAEAMCAYLNNDGLVDGCISQDSDCFAYGAKVVYRNFSISQQGAHAASGGAVDIYDIRKAYESIGFGRNKVVALAILCGCDYFEGIVGVGKDSAMKLFEKVTDEEILERLRSWKKKKYSFEEMEKKITDKKICTSCGHNGRVQNHNKMGCVECKTNKGCDFTRFKDERIEIKNELNMRSKALADPKFPHEDLINEFFVKKDNVSKLDLIWKRPDMVKFVKFTHKYLQWEEVYSFQKLFPILTRWQVINYKNLEKYKNKGIVYPESIKKKRNPKGVPSYEIIWTDKDKHFEKLIPKEQLASIDLVKLWSTIEPQNLVLNAYPDLVNTFEQSKVKPKKKPTKRKKKLDPEVVDELGDILANTSITEQPKPKRKTTKKKVQNDDKQQTNIKTLDFFFSKNDNEEKRINVNNCSTPRRKSVDFESLWMDLSSLEDDEDDKDLSKIIEGIMCTKPHEYVQNIDLKTAQRPEEEKEEIKEKEDDMECSFFIANNNKTLEKDLFETMFEERLNSEEDEEDKGMLLENGNKEDRLKSEEDTEEEKGKSGEDDSKELVAGEEESDSDDLDGLFPEKYIPLMERLKMKRK